MEEEARADFGAFPVMPFAWPLHPNGHNDSKNTVPPAAITGSFPMPSLSLRINLDPDGRIGPGKIELLEHIATFGSISAAARRMGMSYKHAWDLVEEMNRIFGKPVIEAHKGGRKGGGAELTQVGLAVVSRFRAIERAALALAEPHITALQAEIDKA